MECHNEKQARFKIRQFPFPCNRTGAQREAPDRVLRRVGGSICLTKYCSIERPEHLFELQMGPIGSITTLPIHPIQNHQMEDLDIEIIKKTCQLLDYYTCYKLLNILCIAASYKYYQVFSCIFRCPKHVPCILSFQGIGQFCTQVLC